MLSDEKLMQEFHFATIEIVLVVATPALFEDPWRYCKILSFIQPQLSQNVEDGRRMGGGGGCCTTTRVLNKMAEASYYTLQVAAQISHEEILMKESRYVLQA